MTLPDPDTGTNPSITPMASPAGADQALARIRRHQSILVDFSRLASENRDNDRLFQLTAVQAARGIGLHHTKVLRYRPEAGDLLVVAGVGWKPGVIGQGRLAVDIASPPGRALQSRQPVTIDDLPADPDYRYSRLLRDHGIVSVLNAPIAFDSMVWGVIEVDSPQARHFGQDDTNFLAAMANILGLAIQRKRVEQDAAEASRTAAAELARQQTLMRELLHRDKNNFQLIMSLLMMQKAKLQAPEALRGFLHVMDRVAAISMSHDQLSLRGHGTIELCGYLRALCGNLDQRREGVRIETHLDETELSHERAVPLGLITNELVTNAIKYAFPGAPDRTGTIRVELTADADLGQGCLTVADDGVGMALPAAGSGSGSGSGLQLVEALARQIGGWVERVLSDRGTSFKIHFPLNG